MFVRTFTHPNPRAKTPAIGIWIQGIIKVERLTRDGRHFPSSSVSNNINTSTPAATVISRIHIHPSPSNMSSQSQTMTDQPAGSDGTRAPRRTPMACQFCRARKLKCDGRTTCANCERRSIPCVYTPVSEQK
ncbi:hypothetical protein C8Q75DRAFT_86287 [Abortiporus biennis]|nr:hypothetical protein C8Q75DRAFT_86287 [Abortiporus biennis]